MKTTRQFWQPLAKLKFLLPLTSKQWAHLDLLKTLVQRDMNARYKGSILGNLWPLTKQIAQLLIYTYVFAIVLQVKLSMKGISSDNSFVFGLWLFAGLLPWLAFSGGLIQASTSLVRQPNLIKKVVFPLSLLPLVPVLSSFLESTFGLVALITFSGFFVSHTLHPTVLLLPLAWIPQLLITAGLSYFAAGLTVFIRDIPQTLGVLLNLWFYATPLIYPVDMVPAALRPWVFWLNPLTAISQMYRDTILVGSVTHWAEWGVATAISVIISVTGFSCYKKLRPAFADVL
ncbi:ABC-2 type transporter superfamily [Synechococcus sp. PCC 7335]|uniref:ABC transporter permease n=1 Tax=Synechococcus sp. (strain ATCC 29403 / PCC 7335) TaxID=91464 RepID=UPI00017ED279|nr:ABC transporter permease [Synechococcus sp. PCC 7335]EDX84002.1 ABC-2 type transporter superfamily [Synechococcus sp. PCC 7335]